MTMKYFILLFLLSATVVKGQTNFQKTYHGGAAFDFGNAVQPTSDGGFIITGNTALGLGPSDLYLIKTAADGAIQWATAYGGLGNEEGHFVQQTSDGGFIAVGNSDTRLGGSDWDIFLVKTTANGDLQWTKNIGGAGIEEGRGVFQTSDGGFVVTGRASGSGGLYMCLLKLANDGTIQWSKTYGTAESTDVGEAVKQTADGGYIIIGSSSVHGSYDVFLVKTTSDGTLQWTRTFGDSLTDMGHDVAQTADGGYIITGTYGTSHSDSISTSYYGEVYLIKTNAEGSLQWTKTYGNTMEHAIGYSVEATQDGGYVVTAEKNNKVFFMKTSSDGSLQWSKTYSAWSAGKAAARITTDGGFIITGSIMNATTGFDIYLIKTDSAGQSGCNQTSANPQVNTGGLAGTGGTASPLLLSNLPIATQATVGGQATTLCTTAGIGELPEKTVVSLFPNPFTYQTTLESTEYLNNATVTLYNSTGQPIKRIEHVFGHTITLFRENLAAGLYFVYLTQANQTAVVSKVVIID